MMRKIAVLTLCCALLSLAACKFGSQTAQPLDDAGKRALIETADAFMTHYVAGEYREARSMFSAVMKLAMSEKQLEDTWTGLIDAYGPYASYDVANATVTPVEAHQLLQGRITFGQAMELRMSFNANAEIDGFFVYELAATPAPEPPQGVAEEEVSFPSQPDMPIRGTFTTPADGAFSAAVVLVHGSGPQDRDETIGANAPFRDLAHGLAARGVASIRYDKSTYLYQLDETTITVDEETALDAVAAARWLREERGADCVFIVGHSQGGMLASYIESLGAGADGLIVLAGSPRRFTDLIIDQNVLAARALRGRGEDAEADELEAYVAHETSLLADIEDGTIVPDAAVTVFGMPSTYLAHWMAIDAAALHMEYPVPSLFLQGGRDIQVYADVDFPLWKERLAGHPDAEFILYDDLNHIFGGYAGTPTDILDVVEVEYGARTPFDERAIDDIADWIARHAGG